MPSHLGIPKSRTQRRGADPKRNRVTSNRRLHAILIGFTQAVTKTMLRVAVSKQVAGKARGRVPIDGSLEGIPDLGWSDQSNYPDILPSL